MKKQKTVGSAKRFGPRYGRRIKDKVAAIEKLLRSKHKCPYCHYQKIKRLAAGIWQCSNCDSKFTGKAYTIAKKKSSTALEKEIPEETSEDKENEDEDFEETPVNVKDMKLSKLSEGKQEVDEEAPASVVDEISDVPAETVAEDIEEISKEGA